MQPKKTAAGKTIELRIRTYRFGDEKEPCTGSGSSEAHKNSQPFILPSATTSTFKDTLSQKTNSKLNAMLHLSDGSNCALHKNTLPIGKLRRVRIRLIAPSIDPNLLTKDCQKSIVDIVARHNQPHFADIVERGDPTGKVIRIDVFLHRDVEG